VNSVDKNIHFIDLGYGMETKTLAIVVGINGKRNVLRCCDYYRFCTARIRLAILVDTTQNL
jgi:hypothetical protein